eukprot:XP_020400219.1 spidroin-1-like [Zea mays]
MGVRAAAWGGVGLGGAGVGLGRRARARGAACRGRGTACRGGRGGVGLGGVGLGGVQGRASVGSAARAPLVREAAAWCVGASTGGRLAACGGAARGGRAWARRRRLPYRAGRRRGASARALEGGGRRAVARRGEGGRGAAACEKKIHTALCERHFGFGCDIDEDTSNKLEDPWCFLDSYVDAECKDYRGLLHSGFCMTDPSLLPWSFNQ